MSKYIVLVISKNLSFAETIQSIFHAEPVIIDTLKSYDDFVDYLPLNAPALIITDLNSSFKSFRLLYGYLSARYNPGFLLVGTARQLHSFYNSFGEITDAVCYIDKAELSSSYLLDYFHSCCQKREPVASEHCFTENDIKTFETLLSDRTASSFQFKKYAANFPLYQFFSCIAELDTPYKVGKFMYKLWAVTENFLILRYKANKILIIFWSYVDDYNDLILLREALVQRSLSKQLANIWIGCIHTGLYGAYKSFLEAKETFYINYLYHPAVSFDEISSSVKTASKPIRLVEIERQIRSNLEYKKGDSIIRLTQEWFDECAKMNYTLENTQMDLLNLYSSIKYVIFDMYTLHATRIKKGWEVYELFQIRTLEELKEWFFDWLNYTLNNIIIKKGQGFQIEDVLEFIDHHLMEKITLESTAGYFGYNTSYFSTMFKKEMQETFISYVSRQKMKKAFELLQNGRKVTDVAALLGYSDLKYFRTLFKQQYQMNPSAVPASLPDTDHSV